MMFHELAAPVAGNMINNPWESTPAQNRWAPVFISQVGMGQNPGT